MSVDTTMADNEDDGTDTDETRDELEARIEVLTEENRRLHEEYVRARRTQYRRTALALVGVGVLATVFGMIFPASRTVLFALGGTGVFAGLLTYYLTPEQFIAADVGRDIYDAHSATGTALVDELGLEDARTYVPVADGTSPARLFVPQHSDYTLPDNDALISLFVVTDHDRERGVAVSPTGGPLFQEFERVLSDKLRPDPAILTDQLTDALTEQFELVERTQTNVDLDSGRATVGVSGSVYGPVNQFDHPVASFLGVGMAAGLDQPVTVSVTDTVDDRVDFLITCSWEPVGFSE